MLLAMPPVMTMELAVAGVFVGGGVEGVDDIMVVIWSLDMLIDPELLLSMPTPMPPPPAPPIWLVGVPVGDETDLIRGKRCCWGLCGMGGWEGHGMFM